MRAPGPGRLPAIELQSPNKSYSLLKVYSIPNTIARIDFTQHKNFYFGPLPRKIQRRHQNHCRSPIGAAPQSHSCFHEAAESRPADVLIATEHHWPAVHEFWFKAQIFQNLPEVKFWELKIISRPRSAALVPCRPRVCDPAERIS